MYVRPFVIAVLLCLFQAFLAAAGEPVVKGSFHTVLPLGDNCLSVPQTESYLRPGTYLELRSCRNSPEQIFEWNVVTFEIKFHDLCMDAFRVGDGPSQPGDAVGLWYCQNNEHQKWFPHHKGENWLDAFNIVGGGSPSSELCLSSTDNKGGDGAQITIQNCNGGDNQWFQLYPWPPLDGQSVSQRENSIPFITILATSAAQMGDRNNPEPTGP